MATGSSEKVVFKLKIRKTEIRYCCLIIKKIIIKTTFYYLLSLL